MSNYNPIEELIDRVVEGYYLSPMEQFQGLTPTQIARLKNPFDEPRSPFKFNPNIDNETLDGIPFLRTVEELLRIAGRAKGIKLTPLGSLPKKIMVELYAHRLYPEYAIESGITILVREQDSEVIRSAVAIAVAIRAIRKLNGHFVLTRIGKELLRHHKR